MNEERPKIKLEITTSDKLVEFISYVLLLAVWILTLVNYTHLPEIIPTHYNAAGQADGFGGKATILALPIIAAILFIGLTILNKYPHVFNYPGKISAHNALQHYTYATRLIRYLKLGIMILFGLIVYFIIHSANGGSNNLSLWFLPFTLGIIFIPLIYYLVKSFKIKG